MTYRDQLYPWCLIRLLPQAQRVTVARYRRRNEAEEHRKNLRRLMPNALFVIIFEPPQSSDSPVAETLPDPVIRGASNRPVPGLRRDSIKNSAQLGHPFV